MKDNISKKKEKIHFTIIHILSPLADIKTFQITSRVNTHINSTFNDILGFKLIFTRQSNNLIIAKSWCSRRYIHPQCLRPLDSLSSAIRRRSLWSGTLGRRVARAVRLLHQRRRNTAGEALTITSLIMNLHVSASERLRRSEVRRGETSEFFASASRKRTRRTSQKLPRSRAADLAAASALFFSRSRSHGEIHSPPPRIRQERSTARWPWCIPPCFLTTETAKWQDNSGPLT